jgi:hypothetical protein
MRRIDLRPHLASAQTQAGVEGVAGEDGRRFLQQRAKLADFGLLAVEGADLDALLQEAAA